MDRQYPLMGATFGLALVASVFAGWTGFWIVVAMGVLTKLGQRIA